MDVSRERDDARAVRERVCEGLTVEERQRKGFFYVWQQVFFRREGKSPLLFLSASPRWRACPPLPFASPLSCTRLSKLCLQRVGCYHNIWAPSSSQTTQALSKRQEATIKIRRRLSLCFAYLSYRCPAAPRLASDGRWGEGWKERVL